MKIPVQSLVKIQTATPNGKVYENGWCSLMVTTWMWEFWREKYVREKRQSKGEQERWDIEPKL